VPVAPEFRDPDKVENFPPYFEGSTPIFWKREVFAPQTFTVKVRDRNPLDNLYVRWVSDYPEFEEAFSKLLAESMGGSVTDFSYGPIPADCKDFAQGRDATHRLVVIVSDRPFNPPPLAENVELKFNSAKDGATPIMAGWNVTCQ
jgi:hypothetical protein